MDLDLPNLLSQWPHPTYKQHGPLLLHDGQDYLSLSNVESFRKPLFAIHFSTTMQWVNTRNICPFWKCVTLRNLAHHGIGYNIHTNPFHVINSITYGYGLIVVVCSRKGGARACNDGIVVKSKRVGANPIFFVQRLEQQLDQSFAFCSQHM
jgi:hypothetical protein